MVTAFFYGAIFCALCFTVGYRTRFFQILTGICMLSVHNRNTVLHNGGDVVHNLWWMWTIWLPLGRRWSIDALTKSWKTPDPDDAALNRVRIGSVKPHTSFVACAIVLNLALCYYLNGVHKTSVDWINGTAVPYVLEQDRIVTGFGGFARLYFPSWMQKFLTWSTLIFETSSPLFLLLPIVTRKWHAITLTIAALITVQIISTTPLTLTLIILVIALTAWLISCVEAIPRWIPHALHTMSVATLIFLMSFPLWLSILIAANYAIIAVALIHFDVGQRQAWMRRFTLLALAGFHVGAGLSLQLGFFSYWMLSIYFVLILPEDWDVIKRVFRPRAKPLTLFYDGDCGVCHALARLGARLDAYHLITWVGRGAGSNMSSALPGQLDEDAFNQLRNDTIIATPTERSEQIWTHHQAIAQALRRLPLLAPIGWLAWLVGPVGKWAYQSFATRRHRVSQWFGYGLCGLVSQTSDTSVSLDVISEDEPSELSGIQRLKSRLLLSGRELGIFICFIAAVCISFNGNSHFKKRHKLRLSTAQAAQFKSLSDPIDGQLSEMAPALAKAYRRPWRPSYPKWARSFVKYGGFYQGWGLFTSIPKTDGWMIFEVKLTDGRVLDMRTGKAPSYEVAHYDNRTWGFYEARWGLKLLQRPNLRPLLTDWVKRPIPRMRLSSRDRVKEFNLYWVKDQTQAPIAAGPRPPKFLEKKLIHSWSRQAERLKKKRK
jgi:predicted DCC family thiol-disulfide oxidoreductase YuxK